VLKGIECDILESGELDLPADVLAEADWVVCSVHYGQKQPREKITERIVGALADPNVDCIAHPTGRLIGRRDPYEVDIEAVFAAAEKHGKLLEPTPTRCGSTWTTWPARRRRTTAFRS
jgi:DNA polymerase (family 10)